MLDVAHELPERRLAGTVESLERGLELGRDRHLRPDFAPGHHLEGADGVAVGGVGHRQRQLVLVLGKRQRTRLTQEARRDAFLEDRQLRVAGRLDERHAELVRERLGHIALRDQTQRHQQSAELLVCFLLEPQCAIEPRGVELAATDQNLADFLAHRRSGCVGCRGLKGGIQNGR